MNTKFLVLTIVVCWSVEKISANQGNSDRRLNTLADERRLDHVGVYEPSELVEATGVDLDAEGARDHEGRTLNRDYSDDPHITPCWDGLSRKRKVNWNELDKQCGNWVGRAFRLSRMRIAGGYPARDLAFPPYAQIKFDNPDVEVVSCGGTLITSQHVLTAAHCVDHDRGFAVRFTSYSYFTDAYKTAATYRPERSCVSDKWNKTGPSDFAVVKLDRPVNFSADLFPACLPKSPLTFDKQVYTLGLGFLREWENLTEIPDRMYVLPVKRVNCEIDESLLCVRSNLPDYTGDACRGDSGGPTGSFTDGKFTIHGIVSYGEDECRAGVKTHSVSVDVFKMTKKIKDLVDKCG